MNQPRIDDPCQVWIRPMGLAWKISVHGQQNAEWLAMRLQQNAFEVTAPMSPDGGEHCTFQCLTKDHVARDTVEKLLVQWPEVKLQLSPDDSDRVQRRRPNSPESALPNNPASAPQNSLPTSEFPSLHTPLHPNEPPSKPFRVWLRPLGNAWKVRIEGVENCQWLQDELAHRELACTAAQEVGSGMLTFRCMSTTPHEASYVWKLLEKLPQVLVQNDPA